jgi:glutathione S-transferase
MKLYYRPGACSLYSHIVALEAGLTLELVRVQDGQLLPDGSDFKRVNPKGYVAALQLDNGDVLTEGAVIVQYLADQAPTSGLAPAPASFERYRLQEWLVYISTEIHTQFTPLFRGGPEETQLAARNNLTRRFELAAQRLADHPFLMGDTFTAADAMLFVMLSWTSRVAFSLDPWPSLQSFQTRVTERPAVQQALRAEGLL